MGFEPTTFCMASVPRCCRLQPRVADYARISYSDTATGAVCCPLLPPVLSIPFP
jgi:hypothetical protein